MIQAASWRRAAAVTSLALLGVVAWSQASAQQPYPSKPIRLLVPLPPGGPADLLARVISQQMGEELVQQVVVDNRPTIAEQGVAGCEVAVWQSIVVPAGTPREVNVKLNGALGRVMSSAKGKEKLAAAGIEPASSAPEELAAFIRTETEKWGKVIKEIGPKLE
jgi:tripartite-type tricarboxylate transporter receptor subunit TctC